MRDWLLGISGYSVFFFSVVGDSRPECNERSLVSRLNRTQEVVRFMIKIDGKLLDFVFKAVYNLKGYKTCDQHIRYGQYQNRTVTAFPPGVPRRHKTRAHVSIRITWDMPVLLKRPKAWMEDFTVKAPATLISSSKPNAL